jgi:hypothetical protein
MSKSIIIKNLSYSFLITVFFFLITQRVYHLPFSYGDDHRVLGMLYPEKASSSYKAALYGNSPGLKGTLAKDLQIGRFRPLTWSYNKMECLLFGDNPSLFRLSNLIILFLSSFFLLGIFYFLSVDWLSSLLVIAFYIFGRNNETWWTLIPPPQNIGEMFLLTGIYCWLLYRKKGKAGFYFLPALLFFLAGMSKESFIFCIPVLLLTDYLFFNSAPRIFSKEYLFSVWASLLPFSGLLATVLYIELVFTYSYKESLLSIMGYNIFQFAGAAAFFLAPLVFLVLNWKSLNRNFLMKLFSVFAIWTILQLVLLKGIKLDDQHHYLIPWLIYPLILTAISFSEIRKLSKKWYLIMYGAYGIATFVFIKNTYGTSSSYSATLEAYYNMIDAIKKDTATAEVVYLSNNAVEADWIQGTRIIMDAKDIRKELYFTTTAKSIPLWEMSYAKHSCQNAFKHIPLDSVFYPDGKWIILVETPAKNGIINDSISFYKRLDSSFVKINGKEKYIPGKYYYFSVAYPGRSIGDLLRGNFNAENFKGFYAIKLKDGIGKVSIVD